MYVSQFFVTTPVYMSRPRTGILVSRDSVIIWSINSWNWSNENEPSTTYFFGSAYESRTFGKNF